MTRRPGRATRAHLLRRCRAGLLPAEALDPADRERLVADLHAEGLTDADIAERTRMSTYTTARIRARLGLRPRLPWERQPARGA